MKGRKEVIIGILLMLIVSFVPLSQAHHIEQATVEQEPLNSDIYVGAGILVVFLIILALGIMSIEKENEAPPKKRAKKKKAVKKKAAEDEKTYTSNNIEIVELTRRKKVKRKIQW